jgi:CubicO group peptidase (beta-lactamase class C family)
MLMTAKLFHLPAIVAAALSFAAPALAQKPVGKDPVPSILTWTQKQQLERYPAIEKTYVVGTIKKGAKASDLPKADKQVDPKVAYKGKSSSIDDFMKTNRVTGLIAVKDGKVVLEKYALGRKPEDRWTSFSVAKSVTSTLIGAAIKDRYIRSIYDPITYYIPELEGSAYDGVTLREVVTMTSGVKWNEDYTNLKSDVAQAGTAAPKIGEFDPLVTYMAKLKREAPAGTKFVYKTGETDLAGLALTRALAGKSLSEYASEKLWAPYGMEADAIWMVDKAGHERGGCCMSMTLRDYARIGLFMLGGGKIGDKEILQAGWVDDATTNQLPKGAKDARGQPQSYGYFWWPNEEGYSAIGIFGQGIAVYPAENLVIAINSAYPKATDRVQSEKQRALIKAVRDAANGS